MIKSCALRSVGMGVIALSLAAVPSALADTSPSGATVTYFGPPSADPAAAPATTGALPDTKSESPTPAQVTTTPDPVSPPATEAAVPPPATAPDAAPPAEATTSPSAPNPPAAATGPAPAAAPAVAAAPPPPAASPVVEAIRTKLADKSLVGRENVKEDVTALADFYATRTDPVWTDGTGFTAKGKAIIAELRKADDWGLEPSDFTVGDLAAGATPEQQGAAEVQLSLAAMKYARFARGGRLDPVALSNILDMKPPVKEAKVVIAELSGAAEPDVYLRGQNPKHPGFEALRQVLLKARGPRQEEEPVDPALLVKIPDGKNLKPGAQDEQISILRQRLKQPASTTDQERLYDDALVAAIKDVQQANGMKANGLITNRVRAALNKEGQPKKVDPQRGTDSVIANMERWRWLPENLGQFYVMNNIPEFSSEIWKGDKIVLKQKMIVGQPSWPTPVLKADMTIVATHPSWGMPPGIKMKELLPRVQSAGTGFGFFDQLFGGGGGAGGVIRAYKLQAFCNGHQVDPDSVTADNVRNCGFTQPPGPDNPLGIVKFRFPNDHDVYMHDTPERALFSQTMRALSHGCMRVEQPKKTAEVILGEDKGWSAEKVESLFAGSTDVTLSKPFPVYLVYFTARVDENGHLDRYGDIYGHDDRIMAALRGHPVRYTAPEAVDPAGDGNDAKPMASTTTGKSKKTASASASTDAGSDQLNDTPPAKPSKNKSKTALNDAASDELADDAAPAKSKKSKSSKQVSGKRKSGDSSGDFISNSLSGAFLN